MDSNIIYIVAKPKEWETFVVTPLRNTMQVGGDTWGPRRDQNKSTWLLPMAISQIVFVLPILTTQT